MIRLVSLQNDPPAECFAALAGFSLDPTITPADPRAAALVAALPHGWKTLYFGRFDDGRFGVMGSGHPSVPVAIETEPPASTNGRPRGVLSARDVAARLGITPERLRRKAAQRGIGQRLGREWLFSEADVTALAVPGKAGRPRVAS